jgi:hypothetical protein
MIRKIKLTDKQILEEITYAVDIFSTEEKAVAMELINDSINNIKSDYYIVCI